MAMRNIVGLAPSDNFAIFLGTITPTANRHFSAIERAALFRSAQVHPYLLVLCRLEAVF